MRLVVFGPHLSGCDSSKGVTFDLEGDSWLKKAICWSVSCLSGLCLV